MRAWFETRHRREQILVTVFVVMAALTWLFSSLGRLRRSVADWRSTQAITASQKLWLDRREDIEKRSVAAVRNLDPAKTLDGTRLQGTINSLASAAGLAPNIEPALKQVTSQFTYYNSKVSFRRANLAALLSFYDELAKQSPYLNLESITLQTERTSPGVINASMQISSMQVAK
jgi:hypothetical protein